MWRVYSMLQRSPPFSGFKRDILIKKPLVQILIFSSSIFVSSISLAQSISYAQAEQSVLEPIQNIFYAKVALKRLN